MPKSFIITEKQLIHTGTSDILFNLGCLYDLISNKLI